MRPSALLAPLTLALGLNGLVGCATSERPADASRLAAPWTRPAFATRDLHGEPAAVRAACADALASLGFAGARRDGGLGRLSAQNRQAPSANEARQLTFDATLTLVSPGIVRVDADFRELVESADGLPPSGGIIRSRPLYDAFFERALTSLQTP